LRSLTSGQNVKSPVNNISNDVGRVKVLGVVFSWFRTHFSHQRTRTGSLRERNDLASM